MPGPVGSTGPLGRGQLDGECAGGDRDGVPGARAAPANGPVPLRLYLLYAPRREDVPRPCRYQQVFLTRLPAPESEPRPGRSRIVAMRGSSLRPPGISRRGVLTESRRRGGQRARTRWRGASQPRATYGRRRTVAAAVRAASPGSGRRRPGSRQAAAQHVDSGGLLCGGVGRLLHHPLRDGRPAPEPRRFLRPGPHAKPPSQGLRRRPHPGTGGFRPSAGPGRGLCCLYGRPRPRRLVVARYRWRRGADLLSVTRRIPGGNWVGPLSCRTGCGAHRCSASVERTPLPGARRESRERRRHRVRCRMVL